MGCFHCILPLSRSDRRPAGLRSGLMPLHPALGSSDVRQALVTQQQLHSSIFGSSGGSKSRWRTEQLGSFDELAVLADGFEFVASPDYPARQLVIQSIQVSCVGSCYPKADAHPCLCSCCRGH